MPDSSRNPLPEDDNEMRVPQKNALEWSVFVLSLVLVTGTLGYLIFSAVTYQKLPPTLSVSLEKPQLAALQFRVPVTISNDGDQTAKGVQIEVTLNEDAPTEEKANFTVDYLPGHSKRTGAVVFKSDPRTGKIQARVLGYVDP